jgi:hypothetical protein
MKYLVEMASDTVIYIPSFTKIDWDVEVIFRLLRRQSKKLLCWYY